MEKIDQIIHAKWIITCESNNQVLENHALVIKDGLIHYIIPSENVNERFPLAKQQLFPSHALLPGFINTHTHLAMNVFRGLADDLDLMNWLNNYIWPAEARWVSESLVYDGSLLAMAEMIRCGTTCFNDMYFFLGATAKAADLAGVRAHIGMTVIDVPTAWAQSPKEYFAKGIEFYERYKNNDRITPTLAPHSPYMVSKEDLIHVNELANKYDLKINIHLHESDSEIQQALAKYKLRPIQMLDEIGMLSPRLIAVHMTHVNQQDIELMAKRKAHVVHCPESNLKLVSGNCPVQNFSQHGVNVALGTDGAASNNDLDMLSEMRSAAFVGKLAANDPKAVSAEQALLMATLHGAKALGVDEHLGSLTPGKQADFIAIDLETIETQPLYHPISQIVYAASRNQVTDVWVQGKQLLKDRKLQTLDEKELLNKAKSWRNKIKT